MAATGTKQTKTKGENRRAAQSAGSSRKKAGSRNGSDAGQGGRSAEADDDGRTNAKNGTNALKDLFASLAASDAMDTVKSTASLLDAAFMKMEVAAQGVFGRAKETLVKDVKARKPAEKAKAAVKEAVGKVEEYLAKKEDGAGSGKGGKQKN